MLLALMDDKATRDGIELLIQRWQQAKRALHSSPNDVYPLSECM
jgi:hypothetical protein